MTKKNPANLIDVEFISFASLIESKTRFNLIPVGKNTEDGIIKPENVDETDRVFFLRCRYL